MLEAGLPALWSLRSQSVLLTDAHSFAKKETREVSLRF